MATQIRSIRGMTPELGAKLRSIQITDSDQLLLLLATAKRRDLLARELNLNEEQMLDLANRADLARIKGIGDVYADLLEEAGVDTVVELAQRVPANLHAKLNAINEQRKLTTRPPRLDQVEEWVAEAKSLPRLLEY